MNLKGAVDQLAKEAAKKEISNNALVVLISATILITIIGTWVSINKISPITGFAPTTTTIYGQVNVTVNCTAGVSFARGNVNFTSAVPGDSRTSYTSSDLDNSGPFNITNDGTSLINISVAGAALFTSSSAATLPNKFFSYNVTHIEVGAGKYIGNCSMTYPHNGVLCNGTNSGPPNATCGFWRVMQSTADSGAVCRLNFSDGSDSVFVHINITIPTDEIGGRKNATITFTSSVDAC